MPRRRIAAAIAPARGMRTLPSRSITTVPYIPRSRETVGATAVMRTSARVGEADPMATLVLLSRNLDRGCRELCVVEARVRAVALDELVVRALLDDLAVLHHQNCVRVADGRQPVRDDEARAVGSQRGHGA